MKNLLAWQCKVLLWLAPEQAFYTLSDFRQLQALGAVEPPVTQHDSMVSHLALQLE